MNLFSSSTPLIARSSPSKRWSHGIVILVAIVVLAGCAPAPALPPTTNLATTTITFAELPANRGRYEPLIAAFQQQNPGLEVQFVPVDTTTVGTRTGPQIAAAADTSLVQVLEPSAVNVFLDVRPLSDADTSFNTQDFWPGVLEACANNGSRFGLPVLVDPQFLFFDGTVFDAAQWPRPQPGWTWEEFRQAARTLTERSGDGTTRYGFAPIVGPLDLLEPQLATRADSGVQAAGLQWYVELARDGVVPQPDENGATPQAETLIRDRQAVMWSDSALNLEYWQSLLGDQVGLVPYPLPTATATADTNPVSVTCATISSGSSHPEAAWRWISFLSSQFMPSDWRSLPARPSVAERDAVWERVPEAERTAMRAAMEQARFERLPFSTAQELNAAIAQAIIQNVDVGSTLPEPGAQAVQPTAPPVSVAAPQPTASADTLSIAFLTDFRANTVLVRQIAERFNRENPQYRVQVSTINQMPGDNQNLAGQAARFDCFTDQGIVAPADQELFYDLQPLLDADPTLPTGDFDSAQLRLMTQNGRLYALPVAAQQLVVRYNATLLAEQGLPVPTADWTAADFERIVRATAGGSGSRQIYGFASQTSSLDFLYAVQGVTMYDTSGNLPAARFTQPAAAAATNWIAQLVNQEVIRDPLSSNNDDMGELTGAGRVALWLGIAGQQPETRIASDGTVEQPFTIGTLPPPTTDAPMPQRFPINFYISRRAADPTPCWAWMKFLSSQAEALPGMPVRRSVLDDSATAAALGEELTATYRTIASQPKAIFPFSPWLNEAVSRTIEGDDPVPLLDEAQQKMDAFNACLSAAGDSGTDQAQRCIQEVGT